MSRSGCTAPPALPPRDGTGAWAEGSSAPAGRLLEAPRPTRTSQRHQHLQTIEQIDLPGQVGKAVVPFLRCGAIARRAASVDRRHVQIVQLQPVVRTDGGRLVRETAFVDDVEQEVARTISSEDPSGRSEEHTSELQSRENI